MNTLNVYELTPEDKLAADRLYEQNAINHAYKTGNHIMDYQDVLEILEQHRNNHLNHKHN